MSFEPFLVSLNSLKLQTIFESRRESHTWVTWPLKSTVVPGEDFFFALRFWISLNIFRSMRRKVPIFIPMESSRSSAPDKYLKHRCHTHKKIFRDVWKKVHLKIQSKSRNFTRSPIHIFEYGFLKSDKSCFLLSNNHF